MHLKNTFLLICALIVAVLLAGCGDATSTVPVPTATTAAPTTTVLATATPVPTAATPTPPPLPTPTQTIAPTPAPITPALVQSISAGGLDMNLVVTPGKEGINTFYLKILENDKIPTDIVLARLNFAHMDMDMGKQMLDLRPDEPTMPGVYEGKAQVITMVGRWKVDVLVRRQGKADVTSFFQLNFIN